MSSYEVRVPEALILSPIQPWVKMVWISVRSFQGSGTHCFASLDTIGERALLGSGKAMGRGQVSRGLKTLEDLGFIERKGNRKLRCIAPEVEPRSTFTHEPDAEKVEPQSTFIDSNDASKVDSQSTIVEPQSTFDNSDDAPKVDSQSTIVEPQSTIVDSQSTPSKNQKGKPTRKTKKEGIVDFDEVVSSWNDFARPLRLPTIRELDDKRRAGVRSRYDKVWPSIAEIYERIRDSVFLLGDNPRGWRVNFDFIWLRSDGARKILEGNYDNGNSKPTTPHAASHGRPGNGGADGAPPARAIGRYNDLLLGSGAGGSAGLDRRHGAGGDPAKAPAGPLAAQLPRLVT